MAIKNESIIWQFSKPIEIFGHLIAVAFKEFSCPAYEKGVTCENTPIVPTSLGLFLKLKIVHQMTLSVAWGWLDGDIHISDLDFLLSANSICNKR